jgi:hypothetical protein
MTRGETSGRVPNLSPKRRIQIQVPRRGRADAAPLWRVLLSRQMLHPEHPIKLQVKKSDGKALPNRLDRCSMPFFKPPANTLDPFQLELCADAFKQTWFEIAGGCRLPPFQEERLQTEVSAKLCFFAAKGVVDPTVLQGLTVATVKFQRGTGRRLPGTPDPVVGLN